MNNRYCIGCANSFIVCPPFADRVVGRKALPTLPVLITQTPLLRATQAYGQLLGQDFNPLAKLLLLRTSVPY